jgi:hypothetical protein
MQLSALQQESNLPPCDSGEARVERLAVVELYNHKLGLMYKWDAQNPYICIGIT